MAPRGNRKSIKISAAKETQISSPALNRNNAWKWKPRRALVFIIKITPFYANQNTDLNNTPFLPILF